MQITNRLENTPSPKGKRGIKEEYHTPVTPSQNTWLHQPCERETKVKNQVNAPQHREMNQIHHHVCTCSEREKDRRTFDKIVVAFRCRRNFGT